VHAEPVLLAVCVDVDGRESRRTPAPFELVPPREEIAALPSTVGRSTGTPRLLAVLS